MEAYRIRGIGITVDLCQKPSTNNNNNIRSQWYRLIEIESKSQFFGQILSVCLLIAESM